MLLTQTDSMKNAQQVANWISGAAAHFDDPSIPICQLFLRWQDNLIGYTGEELGCGIVNDEPTIYLGPDITLLPIPVVAGEPEFDAAGNLEKFGADLVTTGVWALTPSLNIEGLIHGFVVFHSVPTPAPWERRIVLV